MSDELRRGREVFVYWKRKYEAIQQELVQAQEENRVKEECLVEAMKALRWYDRDIDNCSVAYDAIVKIEDRLALLGLV